MNTHEQISTYMAMEGLCSELVAYICKKKAYICYCYKSVLGYKVKRISQNKNQIVIIQYL